jgi:hypothetical protein
MTGLGISVVVGITGVVACGSEMIVVGTVGGVVAVETGVVVAESATGACTSSWWEETFEIPITIARAVMKNMIFSPKKLSIGLKYR